MAKYGSVRKVNGRPRVLGPDSRIVTFSVTRGGYERLEAEMGLLGLPTMSDTLRRVLREGLEALSRKRAWQRRSARLREKASEGGLCGGEEGEKIGEKEVGDGGESG
jgi:hypothetical protein